MVSSRYCLRHPKVRAGWSCSTCHADLCPDCVAVQSVGHRAAPVDVCCQCRRGVKPITIHRADLIPQWHRILDAPRFPLGSTGLLSLAVLGFVQALTSYAGMSSMMMMGGAVFLLRQGLFWAFLFFIIRSSAEGANKMGVFGLRDIQTDVITPALKGILSTALVWLPAAIYIAVVSDDGVWGILSYEGHKDPVVWLLVVAGILYAPMALLAAATDLGFLDVLNPVRIFATIGRMGRDYFVAIFFVAVVVAFGRILDFLLGSALAHVEVPFLPRWLGQTVGLYAPFVAARILGVLLYTRGEALDWGSSEDYQVPVMPGVRPRGALPDKPASRERAKDGSREVAPPKPARANVEPRSIPLFDPQVGPVTGLDESSDGPRLELAPQMDNQPLLQLGPPDIDLPGLPPLDLAPVLAPVDLSAIDLPPSLPPSLPPVLPPVLPLPPVDLPPSDFPQASPLPRSIPTVAPKPSAQATVRGFSPSEAVALPTQPRPVPAADRGATLVGRTSALAEDGSAEGPADLMARGKAAAKARDFETAARAFEQVASTQGEQAGAALVLLAQVVGDGQKDLARAKDLYREVLTRFPGSDAAAYAGRRLTALGG